MGPQCRQLDVTLRVGGLEDGIPSLDHEGTWLLGHTQNIDFGTPRVEGQDLLVDAVLHLRCRHLKRDGATERCAAHDFSRRPPVSPDRPAQPRQLGEERFRLLEGLKMVPLPLPHPPKPKGSLPVVEGSNPCLGAPCTTADHVRGAACCRDLQVEIMCTRAQHRLEALVRSRRSPYLCKIDRAGDYSLEVEMISACGYLETDGVSCSLHGRHRPDGRTAKPDLCFEWPPKNQGLHPGCIFGPRRTRGRRG